MGNEIVERAAKAHFEERGFALPTDADWEQIGPIRRATLIKKRQAAIAALREPSEAMWEGWSKSVTNTRATIIKACAERQAIYEAKKARAQERGNDDSFDRAQVGYEVCPYLLTDILRALDMAPAEIDDDDRIRGDV